MINTLPSRPESASTPSATSPKTGVAATTPASTGSFTPNSSPKKSKFSMRTILGGIILLLVLVGGGVGYYLLQQNQDLRQQAAIDEGYKPPTPPGPPESITCYEPYPLCGSKVVNTGSCPSGALTSMDPKCKLLASPEGTAKPTITPKPTDSPTVCTTGNLRCGPNGFDQKCINGLRWEDTNRTELCGSSSVGGCSTAGESRCDTTAKKLLVCDGSSWRTTSTTCGETVLTCSPLGKRPIDTGKSCCSGLVEMAGVCVTPNSPGPGAGTGGTSCTQIGGRTSQNNNRACCTGLVEVMGICTTYFTPNDACQVGSQRCVNGQLQSCTGRNWQNAGTCGAVCNNGRCETGEDIRSCPQDCGGSGSTGGTGTGGTRPGTGTIPPSTNTRCSGNTCTAGSGGCIAIHACESLDSNGHCTVLNPRVVTGSIDAQAEANRLCKCVQVDVLNGQNNSCVNGHINGDISTLLDHRQLCPTVSCGGTATTPPSTNPPSSNTPNPTPTPTPPTQYSCNSTCTTDAQCQSENSNLRCTTTANGKRCRHKDNPTNSQCQLAAGPQCVSITMAKVNTPNDTTAPKMGEALQFTCGQVTGAARYIFRLREPDGTMLALNTVGTGRVSSNYTIAKTGEFKVQCQICTQTAAQDPSNNSCLPYESLN